MLKKFKLSTRILALGVINIVCFSFLCAWVVPKLKEKMYEARYLKTRHVVESVWGVLDFYAKQAKADSMPEDEAKRAAMAVIKNLRYEKDDYFWINDTRPHMIMHPVKPELNGKDLSDFKDPNGKRLFVDFVEVCRKDGAGFVDYLWPKPGEPQPVSKISYVKAFPEWGWIIGSGIYLDDVEKELSTTWRVLFTIMGLLILGSLCLSYILARSIARPIDKAASNVVKILDGSVEKLISASGEVSIASQSLAEGATEQASSLEETSSSLEEMASMTRQSADNATQADSLMQEARRVIGEANNSMTQLTTSMNEISRASQQTSKIIKTIDEIAFQTNLLALNAAVEAARAGEAGAGFAVVAEEVRNLAMRAAEAAKNTADLIEGTVKKINDGSELVNKTGNAFAEVATSSLKVGELISEISGASTEQAHGVEQINQAIAEMDKVVQRNAENAEKSSVAAKEVNTEAEEIKGFLRELLSLVGGIGKGIINGRNRPARNSKARSSTPDRKALAEPAKSRKTRSTRVRPEHTIPAEDDFTES
ncbi:MAG: methyl-accepting chemotaxis protein [Pseudomonadota bacterium]